jgi:hypothetical protein
MIFLYYRYIVHILLRTKFFICFFFAGHFYGIGECGRAATVGQCPECKGQVGGAGYRLASGNQQADAEMRR